MVRWLEDAESNPVSLLVSEEANRLLTQPASPGEGTKCRCIQSS